MLNLNTGAPYQPFNRAPQLLYTNTYEHSLVRAGLVWQSQYLSVGPNGKSREYIRNSNIPEMFLGADYKSSKWIAGAGLHFTSLVPRLKSTVTGADGTEQTYKVSERVSGLTAEAHVKYNHNNLTISGKSVLNSNLTQCSTLGGYGVKSVDPVTGEQEYSPIRVSHSWVNAMYGKKWRGGVFLGYLKNLGTKDEVSSLVGTGTNIDQMTTAMAELTYNLPHWKFGAEYSMTTAWYGTNTSKGKVTDTYDVTNHRLVMSALFSF